MRMARFTRNMEPVYINPAMVYTLNANKNNRVVIGWAGDDYWVIDQSLEEALAELNAALSYTEERVVLALPDREADHE